MDATLELRTNSTLAAVRGISTAFAATLRTLVPEQLAAAVQLAVAEACTNLVKHGARGREDLLLTARLDVGGGAVRVTLIDRGTPFDVRSFERPERWHEEPANLSSCGRGLALIHDLMDRVEYEVRDGENVMTLTKYLSRLPLAATREASRAGAGEVETR
jgi:anti-sigma regulatory factor (Ser/Thr protein kinase)